MDEAEFASAACVRDTPAPMTTAGPIDDAVRQRLAAQTKQAWSAPGVIDLGIGQPEEALLPLELMRRAAAEYAAHAEAYPLQYGNEAGDGYLRLALAEFLAAHYGVAVDPEPIVVTNGNSQAIDLACAAFTQPGDVVFVEEPTYFLAIDIFRRRGLRIVGIPVDRDGLSIAALEAALARERPAFVYAIPAFQNPTGATLSAARREQLVRLARQHGFLVVADEVYQLLDYCGDAPLPMAAQVGSGHVLSLGTFSKILAPGLRLGWVQGAPELTRRLAQVPFVVSGGGLNPFASAFVRTVIEHGWLADNVAMLREVYRERVAVMDAALRRHLPPDVEFDTPKGGYFFWLRFPRGTDTRRFLEAAAKLGVGFRAGPNFSVCDGQRDALRLSFAFYDAPAIERAVGLLAQAVRAP